MRPLRLLLALVLLLPLGGCGAGLTRAMWDEPLPKHQPARAVVATMKVVATPVTVVVDGTSATAEVVFTDPHFWEAVAEVALCVGEGCCRLACR